MVSTEVQTDQDLFFSYMLAFLRALEDRLGENSLILESQRKSGIKDHKELLTIEESLID